MNKKLVALLVVILVLCSLGIVACDTHNHEYVEVSAKEATCTEKGHALYYTCSGCDQLFDADKNTIDVIPEIAAKGHSATHVEAKDATCTDAGNNEYWYCSGCQKYFTDANCTTEVALDKVAIVANGHQYVEHAAVAATCTEPGNEKYYTCENCSAIFDADKKAIDAIPTIAANGHKYVEHSENVASCTGTGNAKYYTCENCTKIFNAEKNEIEAVPSITANGHSATHKVAQEPTCENAGNIEHWYCSACEKYFSDENCTQETTFDAVTIAAKGHKYVEQGAKEATCTEPGNDKYHTCENCSVIFDAEKKAIDAIPTIAAKGHKYAEHGAKEATCTEPGNDKYHTCENCSVIFDADKKAIDAIPTIAAKGHKYVEHVAKEATCTEPGNDKYHTCENCSAIFDAEKKVIDAIPTIAAKGHKYVEHVAKEATCTEPGNDKYFTCENCLAIFDADKKAIDAVPAIVAKGHTYAWSTPVENVSVYKCHCGDEKYSVTVSVTTRQLIDVESENVVIDVAQFGQNLIVKSVTLGNVTLNGEDLEIDGTKVTVATEKLLGESFEHGDSNVTISVAIGESEAISVTLPVRVAYTISTLEELEELYTVTDHDAYSNPVVGGTVTSLENGTTTITQYWYVLTADIDGADRMGANAEYGSADESWYTSGSYKEGFVGVFDGQDHTIKNVTVLGHGFFGHVGRGTIQNVNFDSIELAGAETSLIGKVMDSTIKNVKVSNITVGSLSENSGILFYTQCFSATLKDVDIDLSNLSASTNVFCKLLDNNDMWEFDNSSFENVTVKAKHDSGLKLFADTKLTGKINGVTVSFVPFQIDEPNFGETFYYYTGKPIYVSVPESEWYTVSGNGQTNIGSYTIRVKLNFEGISWSDGTTEDKICSYTIVQLTDSKAKEFAEKFNSDVSKLNADVQLPRDKAAIEALVEEYENLNPKVQQLDGVPASKQTLDKLKAEADKYTLVFDTTDGNADYIKAGHNGYTWNGTISAVDDSTFGKVFLLNVTEATFADDKKVADFQIKGFAGTVKNYEYILFYVYNPFDSDAELGSLNTKWEESAPTVLVAKSWTLIKISTTKYDQDGLNGRFYILTAPEGQTAVGEWKVTSFWGYYDQTTTTANVKVVTDAIDAIDLENLALTDKATVVAARTAYDAADGFTKYNVPAEKLKVLTDAEAKIVEFENQVAAQAVIDAIDALTDESDSESILAARTSYDALTDDQKKLVSEETLAKLVAAESNIGSAVADAFAAKVTALGTPVFPRDNDVVYALVTEYDSLTDEVKESLTETKSTLDAYKAEADKWTELAVQFDSDKILNGLNDYDKYYLVVNNPTESVVKFYVAQDITWQQTSAVELAVGSDVWTMVNCPKEIAEGHHIYLYQEGSGTLDFRAGNSAGWRMKVYGAMNDGTSETSILSVGGGIDSLHGKVNDRTIDRETFYTLTGADATTLAEYADQDVYFYIYNPTDTDTRFYATYDWNTNYTNIIMKAKSWTKVCISDLLNDANVTSKTTYFYAEHAANGSGWLMSDFFVAVPAAE